MSDAADRYRKLSDQMIERIAAVPADRWESPSPCDEWTARDIVRHLVDTPAMFFGMAGAEPPSGGPSVDDDPLGAFTHARDGVLTALADPSIADKEYDGMFGKSTFARGVDQFLSADLVVHAWDLARATGGDERLDPDEVRRVHEALLPVGDAMRGPGAFGPEIEPPADADDQTRFLCFLGRAV